MKLILLCLALLQEPPGPHVPLTAESSETIVSFVDDARTVAAFHYYWFDEPSGAHMGLKDLKHRPASMSGYSYREVEWHQSEFQSMADTGIDICAAVYQGTSGKHDDWNTIGVRTMAKALADMRRAPKIAMYYDTGATGKLEYAAIRDFYSLLPPKNWAVIEGRPVVWLGAPPKEYASFRKQFAADFADRKPYIIATPGWDVKKMEIDAIYERGASASGPKEYPVVCVGPGSVSRDRAEGNYYAKSWYVAMKLKPRMVAIETWNGFHDASEVCVSKELGGTYLDLTKDYIDKYKKGILIAKPKGVYTKQERVLWSLRFRPREQGLQLKSQDDGLYTESKIIDGGAITTKRNELGKTRYLYFDIDDSFLFWDRRKVRVEFEYLDAGKGIFDLQYDSGDRKKKGAERWYKSAGEYPFSDTGKWKIARFDLSDSYFSNRQKGGCDFRIAVPRRGITIRLVRVIIGR